MTPITTTQWEVLNATADDWENLESIHVLLRGSGGNGMVLQLREVADAIHELTSRGLLAARAENGELLLDQSDARYVWQCWYRMTEAGRKVWGENPALSGSKT